MGKRASNRERLQRRALEAELTAKEKAEKKKVTKKKRTTKKAVAEAPVGGRLKVVWKVYDPRSKDIATFPYPKKEEAEARAAQLTEKTGQEHRVRGVKVPLDEVI